MLFHRSGNGFSPSTSNPNRRYCYVRASALEQLLEAPGTLESLGNELGVSPPSFVLSRAERLEAVRRRAIHLAVTASPFRDLSLEEILVVTAYASASFDHTAWKRELRQQPTVQELYRKSEAWLRERSALVRSGSRVGRARWPLVGSASAELDNAHFVVAVAPLPDHQTLAAELERLAAEADFAHEHYVACSPATALAFLESRARAATPPRWDSFALDRELRTLGLGLLLVEPDGVALYLPARYRALTAPSRQSRA
jgi:hypothetical protein